MAVDPGEATALVAAVATFLVAAFVLFLDFRQRVHRAFALLLVLRAMLDGMLFFTPTFTNLAGRLRVYWYIAIPFAAVHFALAYRRRHGPSARAEPGWFAPLAILAVALAFEVAYLVDHGLYGSAVHPGPFLAFVFLPWPTYAVIALLFARDFRRVKMHRQEKAMEFAALGFSLVPLFFATFSVEMFLVALSNQPLAEDSPTLALQVTELVAMVSTLVLIGAVTWNLVKAPNATSAMRRRLTTFWGLAFGSASVLAAAHLALPQAQVTVPVQVLFSLWSLALALCVTYALVKHRLFDAEVKLRFAIKGTTLAAMFLAAFFIVNKVTENIVAANTPGRGTTAAIAGGVVAGLLLFALAPLQRIADRLANRAVPAGKQAHGTHAERVLLYREQLEIAWADGRLTPKERLLFSKLQERLGISADEALKLETEVLSSLPMAKPRRRRAAPALSQ